MKPEKRIRRLERDLERALERLAKVEAHIWPLTHGTYHFSVTAINQTDGGGDDFDVEGLYEPGRIYHYRAGVDLPPETSS